MRRKFTPLRPRPRASHVIYSLREAVNMIRLKSMAVFILRSGSLKVACSEEFISPRFASADDEIMRQVSPVLSYWTIRTTSQDRSPFDLQYFSREPFSVHLAYCSSFAPRQLRSMRKAYRKGSRAKLISRISSSDLRFPPPIYGYERPRAHRCILAHMGILSRSPF